MGCHREPATINEGINPNDVKLDSISENTELFNTLHSPDCSTREEVYTITQKFIQSYACFVAHKVTPQLFPPVICYFVLKAPFFPTFFHL